MPKTFCSNCGSPLKKGTKFCPSCGAPAPEPPAAAPAPRRKSRLLPGILLGAAAAAAVCAVLVLTGALSVGGGADTVEGRGFSSPEAAAESYLEALRRGDLDGMLAAFAVESYVEHLDQAAYLDAYRSYIVQSAGLPDDNALAAALNTDLRKQNIVNAITQQYLTATAATPELAQELMWNVTLEDGMTGRDFLAAYVNPQARTWLSEMEIGEATFDAGYQNTDYLNADDVVYGSIPVEIGGRQCLFALQAASYDGRWYLLAAQASLPDD